VKIVVFKIIGLFLSKNIAVQRKMAIVQSNYLPWKGYFHLIRSVEVFVFYDCAAYSKNGWRNRNLIKTPQGIQWLTVPVHLPYSGCPIREVRVAEPGFAARHLKTLRQNYSKAPSFEPVFGLLQDWFAQARHFERLSDWNIFLIKQICAYLGIGTRLVDGRDFDLQGTATEKLVQTIALAGGASHYVSGPSAKNYLQLDFMENFGSNVIWVDYSFNKEYPQLYPPFEHRVSIVDLLFSQGENAGHFIS
jgi:hypothetical protein